MPDTIDALFAFIFAGAAVWTLVPATESLARRIGDRAIDYPNERSLHEFPTPKLGGLAVLVAVLIGGSIFLPWDQETRSILAGAIVITAVGVIDDLVDLPAGVKLLGQTAAAIIPVASGVTVDSFTLPFLGRIDPGSVELFNPPGIGAIDLGQVLTVVGIVAVANVINLIDGVDGLAAGVCLISAAALAVIALSLDRNAAGVLAAVTAGASLGFLRHGFPPASSFMGDTGSNLLGYLMAVVTVQGALKTNAVVALFFPLAVLAVPAYQRVEHAHGREAARPVEVHEPEAGLVFLLDRPGTLGHPRRVQQLRAVSRVPLTHVLVDRHDLRHVHPPKQEHLDPPDAGGPIPAHRRRRSSRS